MLSLKQWRCRECHICRECDKLVTRSTGSAPGTICEDCDRAIHFACHDSSRKPKFLKCRACKLANKKGKNGKSSQSSKRSSDTEEKDRARHSSDSGSTGERDRNGLNDSLRLVNYKFCKPFTYSKLKRNENAKKA